MRRTGTIVLSVFLGMSFLLGSVYAAEMKTAVGGWQLSLSLKERFRYEYKSDFDCNENIADNGCLFYNRVLLNAEAKFKDIYEVFLEGLDARVGSQHLNKPTQKDEFDLHQAFIKGKLPGIAGLTYKFGRQELNYGQGRLVAAATWSNKLGAFDAVVARYTYKGFYGDVFSGYRVKYVEKKFNPGNIDERLDGVYLGCRQNDKKPLVETYLLHQFDANSVVIGRIHRYTAGLRLAGSLPKGFAYDVEIPWQFGDYGAKDIKAYAFHADINKTIAGSWKPKASVEFNMATGDNDVQDNTFATFIPVYQSTHSPYGIMDLYKWQNMREIAGSIGVSPLPDVQCTVGGNLFWLDAIEDSWYNSSGSKVRSTTKADVSSFVGTEVSLVAKYALNTSIALEAGYAHFFAGGFVRDTGAHDDADWLYSMVNFKL